MGFLAKYLRWFLKPRIGESPNVSGEMLPPTFFSRHKLLAFHIAYFAAMAAATVVYAAYRNFFHDRLDLQTLRYLIQNFDDLLRVLMLCFVSITIATFLSAIVAFFFLTVIGSYNLLPVVGASILIAVINNYWQTRFLVGNQTFLGELYKNLHENIPGAVTAGLVFWLTLKRLGVKPIDRKERGST